MDDGTTKSTPAPGAATGASAEASTGTSAPTNPSTAASQEVPPPKPPRPVTEQQKNEAILKEAFPSIDAAVIKAVLIASRGQVDPAFNALLGMSDPDALQHDAEEQPPPQPPRPQNAQSQLEADEAYARQLAQHYESQSATYEARTANRGPGNPPRRRQQTGLNPNELHDDRDHSFIDDDLPVIQEQLKKGFQETQTKVNTWFKDIKKKFDEQFDENEAQSSSQQQHGGRGPFAGRGSGESSRRSRDYERYDADPELLSDDFAGMKFHSDGSKYKLEVTHRTNAIYSHMTQRLPVVSRHRTPTCSSRHHPHCPRSHTMAERCPSRTASRISISTAPPPRMRPRTRPLQLLAENPASGSHCPRLSRAPSRRTTLSVLVTVMMTKTPRTSQTRPASNWRIRRTRRKGLGKLRRRRWRIVWSMTRPKRKTRRSNSVHGPTGCLSSPSLALGHGFELSS